MNARVSKAAAAAMEKAVQQAASVQRQSMLEQSYHQFSDDLIGHARDAGQPADPYLRKLNRIATLTAGIGAVLRIVAGNGVVADSYDPDDASCEPPLGDHTTNVLTNMAAEICEMIADDICVSADHLRKQVNQ